MNVPFNQTNVYSLCAHIYDEGAMPRSECVDFLIGIGMSESAASKCISHAREGDRLMNVEKNVDLTPATRQYFDELSGLKTKAEIVKSRQPTPFKQMSGYDALMRRSIRPDAELRESTHHSTSVSHGEILRGVRIV